MKPTSLRAIGQALEALHLGDFELESHESYYLVRGEAVRAGRIQSLRQDVWDSNPPALWGKSRRPRPVALELRYTPNEIERLEQKGRARRKDLNRMPDPFSQSQVLRGVSHYIERKGGRLMKISRQDRWVTIEYETAQGDRTVERAAVSFLYRLFVRMYLKRSDRHIYRYPPRSV